jgi:hypothetical protein
MAQKFLEVVIAAAKGAGEGFIKGFFAGRGETSEIINLEREEIERESLKGLFEEFIHPGEEILHLLIPESDYKLLKEVLISLNEKGLGGLEKGTRAYEKMSAGFKIEVYNRQAGAEIKELLRELKAGIDVEFKKELKESIREEAEKIELYAPEHSYELRGSGQMTGAIGEILKVTRRLKELGVEMRDFRLY